MSTPIDADAEIWVHCDPREELTAFLKSRKSDKTRSYAKHILKHLTELFYQKLEIEQIRLKDLKSHLVPEKIPDESEFRRVLKDLESAGFVERVVDETFKERGRKPVYYKLKKTFNPISLLSRDELERKHAELTLKIEDVGILLDISLKALKEYGCDDPKAEIEKRFHEIYGSTVEEFEGDD